jgi:hypothetical protein
MRTKKTCPALKHAGYSTTTLLPGENRDDFEKLHRAVVAELRPAGALEDELVLDIARFLWRNPGAVGQKIRVRSPVACGGHRPLCARSALRLPSPVKGREEPGSSI